MWRTIAPPLSRSGGPSRQATHPATVKPELCAPAPNRVWSWDITKLLGPATWTYYYCYVILSGPRESVQSE